MRQVDNAKHAPKPQADGEQETIVLEVPGLKCPKVENAFAHASAKPDSAKRRAPQAWQRLAPDTHALTPIGAWGA